MENSEEILPKGLIQLERIDPMEYDYSPNASFRFFIPQWP
jgi:hypothetical protein